MKFGGQSKGGAATSVPGNYTAPVGKSGKIPRGPRDIKMATPFAFRKSGRGGSRR